MPIRYIIKLVYNNMQRLLNKFNKRSKEYVILINKVEAKSTTLNFPAHHS